MTDTLFFQLILLQPEYILQSRVENIPAMARYVEQVQAIVEPNLTTEYQGYIVVAVRYDGQQRVWYDIEPAFTPNKQLDMNAKIQQLQPFEVNEGVIVFALGYNIKESKKLPNPTQWKELMGEQSINLMEIEGLLEKVWNKNS